jgi:hypothetical protein
MRPTAYPSKIIGHREARERALAAYATIKSAGSIDDEAMARFEAAA